MTSKKSYAYSYLLDKNQDDMLNFPGIYKIGFVGTSKFYIGSTTESIMARFRRHLKSLQKNKHYNKKLQRSFVKYKGCLTLEILEVCKVEECLTREQYYLDVLKPEYNICKIAGNTIGFKMPEHIIEAKRKPVDMFDLTGKFIRSFKSITEASIYTNIDKSTIGQSVKSGGRANNFMFRNSGLYESVSRYVNPESHKILCYSVQGYFITEFESILSASKKLNIPVGNICKHLKGRCKSCYKYIFQYYSDNYALTINPYQRKHKFQKQVIITDLQSDKISCYLSLRQIDSSICTRSHITKLLKEKGNCFIVKKKYKIQIISDKSNDLIEIN